MLPPLLRGDTVASGQPMRRNITDSAAVDLIFLYFVVLPKRAPDLSVFGTRLTPRNYGVQLRSNATKTRYPVPSTGLPLEVTW